MRAIPQVKMIEVKLSQAPSPATAACCPGPKVTLEIAEARAVRRGSTASRRRVTPLLDADRDDAFIDRCASCRAASRPASSSASATPGNGSASPRRCGTGIVPDFIVVDGAEGGTGAAPLEFTDHVGAPLQEGLLLVHNTLVGLNLRDAISSAAPARW
jgi:glutamate synthase domain-containing protein 2